MARTTVANTKNNPDTDAGTSAPDMHVHEGELKKTEGVLYLGIDLGTSRTSVASSNGQRVTISSHVGYPKDVVAKKLGRTEAATVSHAGTLRLKQIITDKKSPTLGE